jgi:hypothetical protein
MFQQYREFPFESELKEMEMRLIARGFNKTMDNHQQLEVKEYSLFYINGVRGSSQEPLRYGIKWVEG